MKVLYIEDCEHIFLLVRKACQDVIDVEWASTLASAKERLGRGNIDVLLVDLGLEDSHGIDTVLELLSYNLPIIVLTGESTGKYVEQALSLGVADFIDKTRLYKTDIAQKLQFAYEKSAKLRKMAGRKLSFGNIDALKPYISYSSFPTVRRTCVA